MVDWEDTFVNWSKPPSETEQQKGENALKMIKDAIASDDNLSKRSIQVFTQGSYRNNTNVKENSDVDVCVCCMDSAFTDLPKGSNNSDFRLSDAKYKYSEFKNDVEKALVNKFGREQVKRGNKAFDINSNSYRVDADVVACFEYRWYLDKNKPSSYHSGTAFLTDKDRRIVNWPEHNYQNGVSKNKEGGKRFKPIIRIAKNLNLKMWEEEKNISKNIPSYLIECLIWNVPNSLLTHEEIVVAVKSSLLYLKEKLADIESHKEWGEINELKYLFRKSQQWTSEDAHSFMTEALNYLEQE